MMQYSSGFFWYSLLLVPALLDLTHAQGFAPLPSEDDEPNPTTISSELLSSRIDFCTITRKLSNGSLQVGSVLMNSTSYFWMYTTLGVFYGGAGSATWPNLLSINLVDVPQSTTVPKLPSRYFSQNVKAPIRARVQYNTILYDLKIELNPVRINFYRYPHSRMEPLIYYESPEDRLCIFWESILDTKLHHLAAINPVCVSTNGVTPSGGFYAPNELILLVDSSNRKILTYQGPFGTTDSNQGPSKVKAFGDFFTSSGCSNGSNRKWTILAHFLVLLAILVLVGGAILVTIQWFKASPVEPSKPKYPKKKRVVMGKISRPSSSMDASSLTGSSTVGSSTIASIQKTPSLKYDLSSSSNAGSSTGSVTSSAI